MTDHPKLLLLAQYEGYDDVLDMLQAATIDSVCPCICMNDDCDYTEHLEPDQRAGYCPECKDNTLQSALVIAGVI